MTKQKKTMKIATVETATATATATANKTFQL